MSLVQGLPSIAKTSVSPVLHKLWLEITLRCNELCDHCYCEAGPKRTEEMSDEMAYDVLRQARGLGCRTVQFIGGEPTLHKSLVGFVRFAHSIGYTSIEIFSNLLRISPELLAAIKGCGVMMATSFYSHDPVVHDRMTATPNSHARTLASIKQLLANGVPLHAGIIETDVNAGSRDATMEFLKDVGVEHVGYDRVRPFGRGNFLTAEERDPCQGLCGQCGNRRVCVTTDGTVMPCIMARDASLRLGSIVDGLAHVLRHDNTATVRKRIVMATSGGRAKCDPDLLCAPNNTCAPDQHDSCSPRNECRPGFHRRDTPDIRAMDGACQPLLDACKPDFPSIVSDVGDLNMPAQWADCEPNELTCPPDDTCVPSVRRGNHVRAGFPERRYDGSAKCVPDHIGCQPDNDCIPHINSVSPSKNCVPDLCYPDCDCYPNIATAQDGQCDPNVTEGCKPDWCEPDHRQQAISADSARVSGCVPDNHERCGPDDPCGPDYGRSREAESPQSILQ